MKEQTMTQDVMYDRYVELIKQRDKLRKEAFQLRQLYIRKFGEKMLRIFRKKLECIKKKKMIAYCQAAINRGEAIDQSALKAYLENEMKEYQKQLKIMIKENKNARSGGDVTQTELLKIKKIYHRIAKLIHPDIFPQMQEEPVLTELWNDAVAAYECNNLEKLQEIEIMVKKALRELGLDMELPEIDNIEKRIAGLQEEILKIRETDPYQYKYLLEDEEAVKDKNDALDEELKSYEDYDEQLEAMLAQIMGRGGVIAWQMN